MIGSAAVKFFGGQFTEEMNTMDYSMMEVIPYIITIDQNLQMTQPPTHDEANKIVFSMSNDSASGSDGYSSIFFQECWDIIEDIFLMVMSFSMGVNYLSLYLIRMWYSFLKRKTR